ncbi:MAG: response regulator transcription factor [Chitinophagaceae bacterium]|nr:MAG: response regulator transcription factor [Chitinophagaceae bacterium]
MRILVAEDEPIMLKTIELRLKKDGHEVIVTDNGLDAMKQIDLLAPDMIITDIMMPYSSGLEIIGKVKNMEGKKIPIIVLSAMGQENVVLEAFNLGADDYITKPFSPNELSMRVKRLAHPA